MSELRSTEPGHRFDPSVPHPASVYAYWLGGKDHYLADRHAAEEVIRRRPQVVAGARANRAFLSRVVRFLAAECGIRQFLDIGIGLPAPNSTHEVAQAVAPECRVVYVDNDPLVLVHARALLTSTPQGACDYVEADVRNIAAVSLGRSGRWIHQARCCAAASGAALHRRHRRPSGDRRYLGPAVGARQLCGDLASDQRFRTRPRVRRRGGLQHARPHALDRSHPFPGQCLVCRASDGPTGGGPTYRVAACPRGASPVCRHVRRGRRIPIRRR